MTRLAALTPATDRLLTDEDLRAGCAGDLELLDGVARAATALALEIQKRTLEAMKEDAEGVPSRAIIAFGRAARVQRQSILLRHRLRRELRGLDRDGPASGDDGGLDEDDGDDAQGSAPPTENRIEATLNRLAEADAHPDHQVERLAEERAEALEREGLEAPLARSLDYHLAGLREELDTAARLAGVEGPSACHSDVRSQWNAAKTPVILAQAPPMAGRRAGTQRPFTEASGPLGPGSPLSLRPG